MKINIPEDIGSGDLKVLPEGVAKAALVKIMFGKSKKNQPKATFKYTILEEYADSTEPLTGETVLETYSLQPQALFSLNDTYKAVTGERLPQGDYEPEEFQAMLEETLIGTEWLLQLHNEIPSDGSSTEERTVVAKKQPA